LPLDVDDVDPFVPLEPLSEDVVVVTSKKKIRKIFIKYEKLTF
jgi:hypothetical protein